MALKILNPGVQPLGQFDGLDTQLTSFLGGEVCALTYVSITANDKHASDVDDGYVSSTSKTRPAVTKTLTVTTSRPLFLADEGTSGYGTLFGQVVGGTAGAAVSGGAQLGPHSATGSGKVTLWDKPGLYAVTLDAVDTTVSTGLVPTNSTLAGNAPLYATVTGQLTPNVANSFDPSFEVGRFIEFTTNGSKVTSSLNMVSALNSPSGGGASLVPFVQAVFYWSGGWEN